MKILVTGASGFIGSHCVKRLINDYKMDLKVIATDKVNLSDRLRLSEELKSDTIKFIYSDLTQNISGILEGIDIVINFAAETFVDHSIKNPSPFIQSNIIGTFSLLEEARRNKVKKFIQISTDEVYGSINSGYFTEDSPLNPGNPYSATKASCDMLCLSYLKTYGIPIVILRPENNYGVYQHPQKAIPTWIKYALEDKPLPVYGKGQHRRMWLHVNDFCEAIKVIIKADKVVGNIFNIGAKQERENISIVEIILKNLSKPSDMINYIPDEIARPGHDFRYGIETKKIESIGWSPKCKIEQELPLIINWYKNNQWWYL